MDEKKKDSRHLVMTTEKQSPDINAYKEITAHARESISFIKTAYGIAGLLVTVIFSVGLGFSYKSASDFRADVKQDADLQMTQMSKRLEAFETDSKQKQNMKFDELTMAVNLRVEQAFKTENIQRIVESKAKERIDAMADTLIKDAVANRVTPVRDELLNKMNKNVDDNARRQATLDERQEKAEKFGRELRQFQDEAQMTLLQIKQQSEFVLTVLAAEADDRKAYDQLCACSTNTSSPFQGQSRQVLFSIGKTYSSGFEIPYAMLQWKEGMDPSKMSFENVTNTWPLITQQLARAYIDVVWNSTNVSKEQKLVFMRNVLDDSHNSLQAADKAARLLADEGKLIYNPPLKFDVIEKWWHDRRVTNSATSDVR